MEDPFREGDRTDRRHDDKTPPGEGEGTGATIKVSSVQEDYRKGAARESQAFASSALPEGVRWMPSVVRDSVP